MYLHAWVFSIILKTRPCVMQAIFLFKVDTASMKEGLEIRVPLLDEKLFNFGLSIPQNFNVKGRTCKRVLRAVAERKLPRKIAEKPKHGFGIPVDAWINAECKDGIRDALLGSSSKLPEFFRTEFYKPMIEAFCEGRIGNNFPRKKLYQVAIMLLSVHLSLSRTQVRIT